MAPSIWQLLIVLIIVLLLFGTKRLRSLGGDLGSAIRGFKDGLKEDEKDGQVNPDDNDEDKVIDAKAEKVDQNK